MSSFYSIITYLSKNIQEIFRRSLLFTIIFNIGKFIEKQWTNSYFIGLYPNENFLSFFKRNNIIKNHIFHPIVVILVFAIFLILSINSISVDLQISLVIAFIAFIIGSVVIPKYFFKNTEKNSFIRLKRDDVYSIGFCLILVGIIFFFLSVASVGGIPLLQPSLRYGLIPILTMPVFLMIPGIGLLGAAYLDKFKKGKLSRSQVRFRFLVLIILSSIFLLLLGYRTPIIAVLLMMIMIGYYGKVLAVWEVVIGALIGVGIIIGIGYFRSVEEFAITTNTSPFYTLQSRADFTLHVLNLLNYISGNFGIEHGALTLSAIPGSTDLGPRMMIGKLIAWRSEVTVTPTLIGPMLVDFGKFGVAIGMGLLGFILGIGYKILQKTKDSFYIAIYALLLTYAILGVETGILDIQVIVYFLLGFLLYLANILNVKKNKSVN
ncbi:oligosaccharide repeat unit polymerase family protein [Methanobrevibacter sp. TMH8]|uniref:oligosaccharide repeat unit polymerase family protein n=1 Tax=Methanobrevibacter sp. TMH8 TaxID=2848611 RepID=UPI001CC97BFA|nr:oligosaccharide repeat unit polymerase family protein [Methanobrevibacter sp. TMH8]MBZ9570810.1 oligosaccharide repeat unit polymerase family protein [Methanobrevibacter sp. TMH8]